MEKKLVLLFLNLRSVPTGEGDEDDVCVGALPRPGGAEPQRSLEAPGHLCLQHRAGSLGGGMWGGGGGRPGPQTAEKNMCLEDLHNTWVPRWRGC